MSGDIMYKNNGYVDGDWLRNDGYYLNGEWISAENNEGYCHIWNRVEL